MLISIKTTQTVAGVLFLCRHKYCDRFWHIGPAVIKDAAKWRLDNNQPYLSDIDGYERREGVIHDPRRVLLFHVWAMFDVK